MNWKLVLVLTIGFMACGKDEDPDGGRLLTQQEIENVLQVQVSGYTKTGESLNAPHNYTYIFSGPENTRVVIGAASSLSGNVIVVDDYAVDVNFLDPSGIEERTVSGTKIYEKQDGDTWRSILFTGQYIITVSINNKTESVGRSEAGKFSTALAQRIANL